MFISLRYVSDEKIMTQFCFAFGYQPKKYFYPSRPLKG